MNGQSTTSRMEMLTTTIGRASATYPQGARPIRRAIYTIWICTRLATALFLCTWLAGFARAGDRESSPRTLAITYHISPLNRPTFREELKRSLVSRLHQLKSDSALQSYRVMFNRYVDSVTWDAMALITFTKESDMDLWKQLELKTPAGLSSKALALTVSIETAPVDLMREKNSPGAPHDAVFLVIPYEYTVPLDEYVAYLDGYVLPQVDGWMEEGVIARYSVYLARYPAGRPWQSLLVLEYKSDQALGARDATVAKVRSRLKENPAWKAMSDNKKSVRIEKPPVIADPVPLR